MSLARCLAAALAMSATACGARMEPIHVAAATGDVEFVKSYIVRKGKLSTSHRGAWKATPACCAASRR